LSGGGHRAALFGLGVLLYLVDAGANQRVTSIASVSGGSLTNGYVAQGVDYSTATQQEFEPLAARLTRQIGARGTLWAAPLTWAYLLLLVLSAGPVVGVWFLPLNLKARLLLFAGALMLVAWVAGMRGWIGARSFGRALFSPAGHPSRLDQTHQTVDHVICATDLHAGEHVYFSGRFVCAYRFGWGEPGDLALHSAVHASAAYPVGFPARRFRTRRHKFRQPGEEQAVRTRYMALVDGGTYDNMGDEWAQEVATRNKRWENLNPDLNEPDELVVVNASAAMSWNPLRRLRLPILGELLTLKRDIDVLYDTTTSTRRRWLFDTFGEDGALRGAIVQISQSPFGVPRAFADRPEDDDFRRRARAVLETLGDSEQEWSEVAQANRSVKTTLSKLGEQKAARLVRHGYVLAMANLHVVLDYPLLAVPAAERFSQLAKKQQ
jgi:predicted acylesterase/phospholipase RssA